MAIISSYLIALFIIVSVIVIFTAFLQWLMLDVIF